MRLSSEFMRIFQRKLNRRSLLKAGMLAVSGCIFPYTAFGALEEQQSASGDSAQNTGVNLSR